MSSESVRKACEKSSGYSRSIRRVRVRKAFGKHSVSIRKAFGKETFRNKYAGSIWYILKAHSQYSERKRKAFGDKLEKTYSEAHSVSFEKLHTFLILKVNRKHSGQCDRTFSPKVFRFHSECFQYAFRID